MTLKWKAVLGSEKHEVVMRAISDDKW